MTTKFSDVRGVDLDPDTRCAHYRGSTDIVAIRMKCCGVYYACKECHDALAGHPIDVWPESDWNEHAVRCGACGVALTIRQYLESGFHCPACQAAFNPRCRNHHHFYFQISDR